MKQSAHSPADQAADTQNPVSATGHAGGSATHHNPELHPISTCNGINWAYLVLPFDISERSKAGDLMMVSLKAQPRAGDYTLLDYGTDNVELVRYDGQPNATGRLYRWIDQTMEGRDQEVAEQRGLVDEYST